MTVMDVEEEIEAPKKRKRKKRRMLRLPFAEPTSVQEWVKVYGAEDAFVPRAKPKPTQAIPGSPEKIEILRQRVEQGTALWHEQDKMKFWQMASLWNSAPWTATDET